MIYVGAKRDRCVGDLVKGGRLEGVSIDVAVTEVFSHSVVDLRASGSANFEVSIASPARWFLLKAGERTSQGTVVSTADVPFEAAGEVLGCFAHSPVGRGELRFGQAPGVDRNEYTVRFFPFISSVLRLELVSSLPIVAFSVKVPRTIRPVWSQATFESPAVGPLEREVAHYPEGWREAMAWRAPEERPTMILLELPLRSSGRELARRVLLPELIWLVSLVGILFSASFTDWKIVAASLVAAWALLLRELVDSDRGHQVTFLSAVFLLWAAFQAIWTGLAIFGEPWPLAVLAGIAILGCVDLTRSVVRFEYVGRLPLRYAIPWATLSRRLELHRAVVRENSGVSRFDHEIDEAG